MTITYAGTAVGIVGSVIAIIVSFSRMFISMGILMNELKELKKDVSRLETKLDEHNNFGVRIAVLEHSYREVKQKIEDERGKERKNV
jgi:hypothetical protein